MHFPRNRTRWDKYMLQDISNYKFYSRSELVRLRGKYTVQTAHCAVARGEEHVPVLKTPEKELSSPPITDLNRPLRKPFKCEQCDFSSDTKRGLSVHIGKAHRPEQAIENSLLFDCQFCDGEECVQETNDRRLVCDHCDNVLYS